MIGHAGSEMSKELNSVSKELIEDLYYFYHENSDLWILRLCVMANIGTNSKFHKLKNDIFIIFSKAKLNILNLILIRYFPFIVGFKVAIFSDKPVHFLNKLR